MPIHCDKCSKFGLTFKAKHIYPIGYLEGSEYSKIWVIGLNPKADINHIEERTEEHFTDFRPSKQNSYFYDFNKVSPKLYKNWESKESIVAHTDIVKCFSNSFPPQTLDGKVLNRKSVETIVQNCQEHLLIQIQTYKPKIIICNGSIVCSEMIKLFPPNKDEDIKDITSYVATYETEEGKPYTFRIVLSGFIGRIDDRSKRRLGKEIEKIIEEEKIIL